MCHLDKIHGIFAFVVALVNNKNELLYFSFWMCIARKLNGVDGIQFF